MSEKNRKEKRREREKRRLAGKLFVLFENNWGEDQAKLLGKIEENEDEEAHKVPEHQDAEQRNKR
jgi:hypothetical protein